MSTVEPFESNIVNELPVDREDQVIAIQKIFGLMDEEQKVQFINYLNTGKECEPLPPKENECYPIIEEEEKE